MSHLQLNVNEVEMAPRVVLHNEPRDCSFSGDPEVECSIRARFNGFF